MGADGDNWNDKDGELWGNRVWGSCVEETDGERQKFTGLLGDGQYTVLLEAEGGDIVVN